MLTEIIETEMITCPECDGNGTVLISCCGDLISGTEYEDYLICPTCKEHIGDDEEPCEYCDGKGEIPKTSKQ